MTTGLSDQLTTRRKEDYAEVVVRMISLNSIVFSPFQARHGFDEADLGELAQSIREHGVLQPILVRPFNKGFELIAGERRVRASKIVGVQAIPAIVREMDDRDVAITGLVENLQRKDLDPVEEAEGYRRLIEEFGVTQEAIATRLGRSQSSVANKLRLLRLPDEVRDAISREIITERHARALLSVKNRADQLEAFLSIVEKGMNVKQAEDYINEVAAAADGQGSGRRQSGRRLQVVKDIRIFLNSFKEAVKAVRRAGIEAEMAETDEGERIRIVVTVAKRKTGQAMPQK